MAVGEPVLVLRHVEVAGLDGVAAVAEEVVASVLVEASEAAAVAVAVVAVQVVLRRRLCPHQLRRYELGVGVPGHPLYIQQTHHRTCQYHRRAMDIYLFLLRRII